MRLARQAGLAVLVLGTAVLCAGLLGLVESRPAAAIAFVLLGIAAVRLSRSGEGDPVTAACGLAVLAIGVVTLLAYGLARAAGPGDPVRPGPITAGAITLLGLAVLGLPSRRWQSTAQWAAVAGGYLGVLNFFGFAHRLPGLAHLSSPAGDFTDMAAHTAAGFVLGAVALLAARPRDGMMAIVLSDGTAGMLSRRFLAAALALPPVLGWLRLVGEALGIWGFGQGWAVLALTTLALFVLIVWRSARTLHQTDTERRHAERALRRAHDELERRVQQRTLDLEAAVQALEEEVAERRRVGQALQDSETRYRALVEASRGLICSHTLDGTLLMVNPAAAAVLGYAPAELVGRSLRDLLAPSVRERFPDYLAQMAQAPIAEGVMRVVTRSGEERLWVYTNVKYEEAGRPSYVLGHAHDITELKRVEALAREAAALRSVADLANAAAHEINNPLAIVVGQLEMIRLKVGSDPAIVARIETATDAVRRISGIISNMARITRLERLPTPPSIPPLLDLARSSESSPSGSEPAR